MDTRRRRSEFVRGRASLARAGGAFQLGQRWAE